MSVVVIVVIVVIVVVIVVVVVGVNPTNNKQHTIYIHEDKVINFPNNKFILIDFRCVIAVFGL
jgi:hypothetical protein